MDEGVTLRPPPVCTSRVDACVRTEWEPPTLRAALSVSTRPSGRLLDGFVPLRRRKSVTVVALESQRLREERLRAS